MDAQMPVITSVSSGKGGVGKTFVTLNMAACLARQGRKVLVVDCDLGLANMDLMLGIMPEFSLKDVIFGSLPVEDVVITTGAGFDLIPGSSGVREMAHLLYEKIQEIKLVLQPVFQRYQHVLLDTGAGLSEVVLQFNLMAERNIVVLNKELTSLTDAYAVIKVLYQVFGRDAFSIVANSAEDEKEGRRIFSQIDTTCRKFLGFPLDYLGYVRKDDSVPRSILRQQVLSLSAPESAVALNFVQIAKVMSTWEK